MQHAAEEAVTEDEPGRAFVRLKESIGSLMLCWARLEEALQSVSQPSERRDRLHHLSFAERLKRVGDRVRPGQANDPMAAASWNELARDVDRVRRARNLIVHGLIGISSDLAKGDPHITCRATGPNAKPVTMTQNELSDLLQTMDRCAQRLERLGLDDGRQPR